MQSFDGLRAFYGDIHNHCGVGYGHGSLDDAYTNAKLQLDFVAITPHAHWHDIPDRDERLAELVDYHNNGFERTRLAWDDVQAKAEEHYVPGEFVPFLAYEWHSNTYGDHNVYYREPHGEILRPDSLEGLRDMARELRDSGRDVLLLPHHIGYRQGSRGINWDTYSPEFSPVVESMSMHGAAEGPDAPHNYLHTMGPRDWRSTYQYGLAQGHLAGVIGSTDHHSAHPGSYGHGRLGVWSETLTRNDVWDAIKERRTYALTGDRMALKFNLNEVPMGGIAPSSSTRKVAVAVEGGGAIDYVEVVRNNRVVHRSNGFETPRADPFIAPVKVHFEVGWGEVGVATDWDVELRVSGGSIHDVEPRFRGGHVVAPQSKDEARYTYSSWSREGDTVGFKTATRGNSNASTSGTQGMSLEIQGDAQTTIEAVVNGRSVTVTLESLLDGPHSEYLGGFLTPAFVFHRALAKHDYYCESSFEHEISSDIRDWYYVRVRQHNGQWAWSSPVWIEPV